MKDLEYNRATLFIQAGGCRLNVFRVGNSPRLNTVQEGADHLRAMKWTHTHFTYEVFFVTSGSLTLVTEYYTRAYRSTVLIIPPKLKHFSVPTAGESYCLLFSFDEGSQAASMLEKQLSDGILAFPMAEDVAFYIRQFTEKTMENTDEAEADAEHLACLIFARILAAIRQEKTDLSRKKQQASKHISAIEAFINQNIHRKLALSDVSAAVYLSTKQIARIIEREYGCSFSELITDKRLAQAVLLLKNTDMKIADIAAQTFCGAPTYFYAVFKSKYGMSQLK